MSEENNLDQKRPNNDQKLIADYFTLQSGKLIKIQRRFDNQELKFAIPETDLKFSQVVFAIKFKDIISLNMDYYYDNKKQTNDQQLENKYSRLNIYYFDKKDISSARKLKVQCILHKNEEEIKQQSVLIYQDKLHQQKHDDSVNQLSQELNPFIKQKLLVFVNPFSGKGYARQIYLKAKNYFDVGNCELNLIETTHQNHAFDYIKNIAKDEILQYNGIVVCSGDGLIHEIINGINHREDASELLQVAIGHLPGGSSNALHVNVCRANEVKEENNLESACYFIIKGQSKLYDLMVVEREKQPKLYSFLSICFGVIADIDIGSEFMRWIGSIRYDLYGAWRWLRMKKYQTILSILTNNEAENDVPSLDESIENNPNWTTIEEECLHMTAMNLQFIDKKIAFQPDFDNKEHIINLQRLGGQSGRTQLMKMLLNLDTKGSSMKNTNTVINKIKAFRFEVTGDRKGFYSIDGEKIESQKIQVTKKYDAVRVFC